MIYSPYVIGQVKVISKFVWSVFQKYEAPEYPEEGIATFKAFIDADRLKQMACHNDFRIYCCFDDTELVGVLALRDQTHISMLFVHEEYQGQGIAKALLSKALRELLAADKTIGQITVNSSPYAVNIYRRMGFVATSEVQQQDGILFIPMIKKV